MKISAFLFCFLIVCCFRPFAQLYMTKTGSINFFSHTILENVDATNNHVLAVINIPKKDLAFSLYMKQFVFRKKLMQEHFNENYVESDKFPKATFSGSFSENVPLDKEGTYPVKVRGKLSIHGVTKPIEIPATLTVKSGTMTGTSTFKLNPKDFDISIPFIVRDKIEKENTVTVNVEWTRNN